MILTSRWRPIQSRRAQLMQRARAAPAAAHHAATARTARAHAPETHTPIAHALQHRAARARCARCGFRFRSRVAPVSAMTSRASGRGASCALSRALRCAYRSRRFRFASCHSGVSFCRDDSARLRTTSSSFSRTTCFFRHSRLYVRRSSCVCFSFMVDRENSLMNNDTKYRSQLCHADALRVVLIGSTYHVTDVDNTCIAIITDTAPPGCYLSSSGTDTIAIASGTATTTSRPSLLSEGRDLCTQISYWLSVEHTSANHKMSQLTKPTDSIGFTNPFASQCPTQHVFRRSKLGLVHNAAFSVLVTLQHDQLYGAHFDVLFYQMLHLPSSEYVLNEQTYLLIFICCMTIICCIDSFCAQSQTRCCVTAFQGDRASA